MFKPLCRTLTLSLLWLTASFTGSSGTATYNTTRTPLADRAHNPVLREASVRMPLAFVRNQGQSDKQVLFLTNSNSLHLFLTPTAATFVLPQLAQRSQHNACIRHPDAEPVTVFRMRFRSAAPHPHVCGLSELSGKVNYLLGNSPQKWHKDVGAYAQVRYERVYPGIDLIYHGTQQHMACDFVVAPHAAPERIAIAFDGPQRVCTEQSGSLCIQFNSMALRWPHPVLYQRASGRYKAVSGRYVTSRRCHVGFQIGKYDHGLPLVIETQTAMRQWSAVIANDVAPIAPPGNSPQPELSRLSHWFVGGISGKSLALVGDSTSDKTANAPQLYAELANYTAPGQALAGVKVLDFGSNGNTAANFLAGGGHPGKLYSDLVAAAPELIVFSMGINDVRLGRTSQAALATTVTSIVNNIRRDLPDTDIILRIPNGHSQQDTNGIHYVKTAAGVIVDQATNHNGAVAQTYSDTMWNAYKSLDNRWKNVVLLDVPTAITGRISPLTALSGGMSDQIHPGKGQYTHIARAIVSVAGIPDETDPKLAYATFLGGTDSDSGTSIAIDGKNAIYITGRAVSADFPVTNGAFETTRKARWNAFVTKLSPDGTSLVYSTFLGGSGVKGTAGATSGDAAMGIAVNAQGFVSLTGITTSADFPVTPGAFQTVLKSSRGNAFVTRLSQDGASLIYSTYLGGSSATSGDVGNSIAVDLKGTAYIAGTACSPDFPVTHTAFQTKRGGFTDGFVTRLSPNGAWLIYSTYLGGTGNDSCQGIATDGNGAAYVAGVTASIDFPVTRGAFQTTLRRNTNNAFITKVSPDGLSLAYSTYLGGSDGAFGEIAEAIALDTKNNAYVTGSTTSSDFPVTRGAFQTTLKAASNSSNAFVTKLNATGSALIYSTYLGGTGTSPGDNGHGIALDAQGDAIITGQTASPDFPVTHNAFQTKRKGPYNAFVTRLNATGSSLVYSTLLGGTGNAASGDSGNGIALDLAGDACIVGATASADLPVTLGAFQTKLRSTTSNAFVAKLHYSIPTYYNSSPAITTHGGTTIMIASELNRSDTGLGLPDANIVCLLNGAPIGIAMTDANGNASIRYTLPDALSAGTTYPLLLRYSGDAVFGPTTARGTLVVLK